MQKKHGGDIWKASQTAGRGLIDFSSSINPEGLATGARAAIRELFNNPELSAAYPDPCSEELIAALSAYLGLAKECVLAGNGSTAFIYLLPQVLRPRKALIVEPAFSEYAPALTQEGAEVIPFSCMEEDGFALDPYRLKKALRDIRPDILYMANPTNHIGRLLKKEELLDIADYCSSLGLWLVLDEAFIDFHEADSITKEAAEGNHIIVLRSMTKFFALAALRLGYIVADKGLIERFRTRMPPWSLNTVAAVAGTASLTGTAYIQRARDWLDREGPLMRQALASVEGLKTYSGEANFITSRLMAEGLTATRLRELLINKGFLIRDLSDIRGLDKVFFRIAVRNPGENRLLITAIKTILKK